MADIRINALANTATSAASDDYLALDGSANGTRKILATNVAQNVTDVTLGSAGPSVKSSLSARAPRQGLVFDGTAGATVSGVPAFATSAFTLFSAFDWNSNGSFATLFSSTGSGGVKVLVQASSGKIRLYTQPSVLILESATALAEGKTYQFAAVFDGTNAKIYINGVLDATTAYAHNFTDPITGFGVSDGTLKGKANAIYIYNRALSASEVVALYESGAPSGADYNTASNTSVAPASFASGWTISGGSPTLSTTATMANGDAIYFDVTLPTISSRRYRAVFTTTGAGQVKLSDLVAADYTGYLSAGSQSVEFTLSKVPTRFGIYANGNVVVSSLTLVPIGALLAPDAAQAGGGYVWNDQSGNLAQIVLPSSGVQWNLPSVAGQRIRGTTSTNGNQQLLGASVLLPAECQITHVRARARSGTPTITIGTASGGAQIVASVALSTTWLNCTIALTGGIVSSADDIWIGSNSTDVVETDIAFQPLDF